MNPSVKQVFDRYPIEIKSKMLDLRNIILGVAQTFEINSSIEETLKWGEPSYLLKGGSTIRTDWKETTPEYLYIYFNCRSRLILTFRECYGKELKFEGKRAVMLDVHSPLPKEILSKCFEVALTYHKRKKLYLLGI